MLLTTTSERQGRAIDKDQGASMEIKNNKGISDSVDDMVDQTYKPTPKFQRILILTREPSK